MTKVTDTIVAQATATGRGGVGIIRVSGPDVELVAKHILGKLPKVRYAEYLPFMDDKGEVLDQGIALFFKAPHSFTGEDVLELQGHGGPIVMDMLIQAILTIKNLRGAAPGEFSERAFLNDKMDLAQAEAIADLIEATSEQAARSALHSLQGEFSNKINALVESLIHLRIYVEASIDFPEEEVDFLSDGKIASDLAQIVANLESVKKEAQQGAILRDGMKVVIAGRPNAGKSSLLNSLVGADRAIVTEIAGTTRDVMREYIHIDGMPLHIIDTAGLRESADEVEKIGIERAWKEIKTADRVLFMLDATTTDSTDPYAIWPDFMKQLPESVGLTVVRNKADLTGESVLVKEGNQYPVYSLSAKTGLGMQALKEHLKESMGYTGSTGGGFMARRRHLEALDNAQHHLLEGKVQLEEYKAGELLAEELRITQQYLSDITGAFSSDDLLGKIFSSFCIGK
ncbi:tRNA modification GTPase TrmE [Psychromonas sp. CNPT3]|uniref:tRNA uridine-5-carboxymethylaminomethyl(34) synthesis GTPase MnmE n=1 Tax=Psychromonas sp. CNPT3 TaxID=314282 RepID=UPI00006E4865|nr:tRNA uridine-5-carboxymethylaminomethyl(34) synthesis GTPase MnmE [Psychromonas sp. CNPT3]AGH82518.1 tRNA modification GTPase TrmE [Psychromonas sp. CNPT3]